MGMAQCFVAVSTETLRELRKHPETIDAYLHPDDGDSEPPNYLDVDKAWHGIHYLLTGTAFEGSGPGALAVFGGTEFGPEVGYGPARFLEPEQVRQVSDHLSTLPLERLKSAFDPRDMAAKEIYPEVIWLRDGSEALEYLLENYQQLAVFYRDAASRGDAVIQWTT
jgi:hypothetical protein